MASYHRKSHGGIAFSLTLHVALVAAFMVSGDLNWRREPPPPAPIQAEIIDAKAFEAEIKAKDDAKRAAEEAEIKRREELAAAERQRELDAQRERDRIARAEAEKREQERIAEQKRAEEQEKQRVAQQQAEQARIEKERKEREEQERKAREEQERLAREEAQRKAAEEARRKAAAEEEALRQQLAAEQRRQEEAARAAAARQTARDAYIRMITDHIEKRWSRPPSAQPGLRCVVKVRQIPSGDIVSSAVTSCNGDELVRRSVEAAMALSSPLPTPSDPSLFERELEVIFAPVFE